MKKPIIIIIITTIVLLIVFSAAVYLYDSSLWPALAPSDVVINREGEVVKNDIDINKDGSSETEGQKEDFPLPLVYPDDFNAFVYAGELGKARDIMEAPDGIIVASMAAGKVIYLPDTDYNNKADEQLVLLSGRYNPHGMAEYCEDNGQCWFYLAETKAVYRFIYDKERMELSGEEKIIDLPDDGGHHTRHILIKEDKDGPKLLITVGSKCNVCVEQDWRRAKILSSELDGSVLREYASGLRNSVFMEQNPFTGRIYATDMGRDWLGDDLPPEEVNIIEEGKDYGWPNCYGNKIHDADFDKNTYIRNPCEDSLPPAIIMPAHSAPLGLSFIYDDVYSEEYWHDLLVAQHGSWNRTAPAGYKVVRHKLDKDGNYSGTEDFVSGFLQDNEAWGRPADVLSTRSGKIYISDDKAGAVYLFIQK